MKALTDMHITRIIQCEIQSAALMVQYTVIKIWNNFENKSYILLRAVAYT